VYDNSRLTFPFSKEGKDCDLCSSGGTLRSVERNLIHLYGDITYIHMCCAVLNFTLGYAVDGVIESLPVKLKTLR